MSSIKSAGGARILASNFECIWSSPENVLDCFHQFQKGFTFFSQSSFHFALNDGFSCFSLCLSLFSLETSNLKEQIIGKILEGDSTPQNNTKTCV